MAGAIFAQLHSIPAATAAALLAAITVEAGFYLVPGMEEFRRRLECRFSPRALASWMTASALAPYIIYAAPTGEFRWLSLGVIAALAAVVSFWYAVLPKRPAADLAFVSLAAAVILAKIFGRIYTSPVADLRLDFLGQLMWIRLALLSVLSIRGAEGTGFGFFPRARDWKIGAVHFACFLPLGVALGALLGFASFHPRPGPWWINVVVAAGTFAGMLWVVALSEEFFFRGLLQQWLARWLGSRWGGLAAASVLFGLVHLPFRSFPNWRFAILAAAAGVFYGLAFLRAGSIRAAMVAHALVNTTWRMLFS